MSANLRGGSRRYWEELWQAVPQNAEPPDLRVRLAFALARLGAVEPRVARLAGEAGAGGEPQERPSTARDRGCGQAVRVLDVGCGAGEITAELARAGFDVVGVDVAEEPLRRARRRAPQLDFRLLDVDGEWPLSDASFDAVWAGETIEHVLDTAAWLSHVRRVLRSGGALLLSTPAHDRARMLALALSARRLDAHFDPRSDHVRFYTRRTLARLLADFGFEQIEVRGGGGPPLARRELLAAAVRSRY